MPCDAEISDVFCNFSRQGRCLRVQCACKSDNGEGLRDACMHRRTNCRLGVLLTKKNQDNLHLLLSSLVLTLRA